MKFLPAVEFEKRQKLAIQNRHPAIMSSTSIVTKIGFQVELPRTLSNDLSIIVRGDTMIFIKKIFCRKIFFNYFILTFTGSLLTEK